MPNSQDEHARRVLETLLHFATPKADGAGIAQHLLEQFGSLAPIVESTPSDLVNACPISETAAFTLSMLPELTRYAQRERAASVGALDSWRKAGRYLSALFLGCHDESFYLLSLDAHGMLKDCSLVQRGTVDEAAFYPRRVLELALRCDAYAVVLSHNHPGGTAFPSPDDLNCTRTAIEALLPLNILVLDHLLIADKETVSLRAQKSLDEALFARQRPGDRLIEKWLK